MTALLLFSLARTTVFIRCLPMLYRPTLAMVPDNAAYYYIYIILLMLYNMYVLYHNQNKRGE